MDSFGKPGSGIARRRAEPAASREEMDRGQRTIAATATTAATTQGNADARATGAGASAMGASSTERHGVADIAEALFRILFETSPKEGAELRRDAGKIRLRFEHRRQRVGDRIALVQLLAGQQLIHDDAEGPDVRALIHHFAASLLRAHVSRCPKNHARLRRTHGERRRILTESLGRRIHLRQSEIEDFNGAVCGDLNVRGLQVAMDDAFLMRGFERGGKLLGDRG